jgi:sulfur carrier protein
MTAEGIAVVLNGEPAVLAPGTTVADVIGAAGVAPEARGVAVALDGEVVRRSTWAETVIQPGARVEVLTAVAGG